MKQLTLPAPRLLPWALRSVDTARSALSRDRLGRMVMHIEHQILSGITPEMVAFWFANIGGTMEIGGEKVDRYLAWHPFDHIRWELARPAPGGGAAVGAKFRIVEAFGREPANHIDVVEEVVRLDASGLTLVNRRAGIEVSRLSHDFFAVEGGTRYVSTLTVGLAFPLAGRLLNPLLHRAVFPREKGLAWIKHNIEEVGLLEYLIPLLLEQLGPEHV